MGYDFATAADPLCNAFLDCRGAGLAVCKAVGLLAKWSIGGDSACVDSTISHRAGLNVALR